MFLVIEAISKTSFFLRIWEQPTWKTKYNIHFCWIYQPWSYYLFTIWHGLVIILFKEWSLFIIYWKFKIFYLNCSLFYNRQTTLPIYNWWPIWWIFQVKWIITGVLCLYLMQYLHKKWIKCDKLQHFKSLKQFVLYIILVSLITNFSFYKYCLNLHSLW